MYLLPEFLTLRVPRGGWNTPGNDLFSTYPDLLLTATTQYVLLGLMSGSVGSNRVFWEAG